MKKSYSWSRIAVAMVFAGTLAASVWAAEASLDPLAVAPTMYKSLFENDRVRVMQVTFKAGEKIGKHTHPGDHFVYVLEGGKLKISKDVAAPNEMEVTVGQVLWIPAETHWAENTGKTQVRLLVSELKSPAVTFKTPAVPTK